MKKTTKAAIPAKVAVKITRADGSVEDWGTVTFKSWQQKALHAVTHPLLMLRRAKWRLGWYLRYKTPA